MGIVIDADTFLASHRLPTIDVRSPGEFGRGHIPSANNVPLLDDAEREEIGIIYKNVGSQSAIARGRELVGFKIDHLVDTVKAIVSGPDFVVHCWRGGMRSESFAGLLEQYGFRPRLLQGGYKAYRRAAHCSFAQPRRIIILSGHSGAGKTRLLHALQAACEQVIDLEGLACHRGSVFGGINQPPQPTVEQFENDLFLQWRDLDPSKPVWIEGESQSIGKVFIPQPVWEQMSAAPAIFVDVQREQRVELLVEEYGDLPVDELALAMERISKRLGGARLRAALEALQRKDVHTVAELALEYYDKAYSNSLQKSPRELVINVPLSSPGQSDAVTALCQLGNGIYSALASKTCTQPACSRTS
jgi:tRNA 2-selenouridine synthase